MQILTPGFYDVFSGTLDQGIFCREPFEKVWDGFYTVQHCRIHNVDFSGRNVAVLLSLHHENDHYTNKYVTDLNSTSIYSSRLTGIDCHHHWGRISLAKLKKDKGITLVDSEPKMVTTLGDLRYQQRLDSFFKGDSRHDVVHPLFAPKGRFDPETLAAHGWEYVPPLYDNEEDARLSLRYLNNRLINPTYAEDLLKQFTAKDAISSNLEVRVVRIHSFNETESFPDTLVGQNDAEVASDIHRMVKDVKKLHETSLLSLNDQPQKAAAVKLAGYHDYLLTTLDNIDKLNFNPLPDHELLSYFRDSWPDHIRQVDSREFELNTLPTLGKILPAVDKNYQLIVDFIDMIGNMGQLMIGKIEPCNIKRITKRMVEFQQLYRELSLIHKQIEFYQTLEEILQQKSDALHDDSWRKYLATYPSISPALQITDNKINRAYEHMNILYYQWFTKFHRKEKEKAISRLKVLDRKLSIATLKIGTQSDLEKMLLSFTGRSISLKHSAGNEELRNQWDCLSTLSNEILALIAVEKLTSNSSGRKSLEYLDLATDFCFRPAGDLKPAS